MYVIAKYQDGAYSAEAEAPPELMGLFRNNVCSVDLTNSGTVCHGKYSDEVFSEWYTRHFTDLNAPTWSEVENRLVSPNCIVVKGTMTNVGAFTVYIAEDESVISTAQAKACGLWNQILDDLIEDAEPRGRRH